MAPFAILLGSTKESSCTFKNAVSLWCSSSLLAMRCCCLFICLFVWVWVWGAKLLCRPHVHVWTFTGSILRSCDRWLIFLVYKSLQVLRISVFFDIAHACMCSGNSSVPLLTFCYSLHLPPLFLSFSLVISFIEVFTTLSSTDQWSPSSKSTKTVTSTFSSKESNPTQGV